MTEKQKLFEGEAMQLYKGDFLEEMKKIPDGSVDLVLTDLPYGVTEAERDTVLPLPELWMHWRRMQKTSHPCQMTAEIKLSREG